MHRLTCKWLSPFAWPLNDCKSSHQFYIDWFACPAIAYPAASWQLPRQIGRMHVGMTFAAEFEGHSEHLNDEQSRQGTYISMGHTKMLVSYIGISFALILIARISSIHSWLCSVMHAWFFWGWLPQINCWNHSIPKSTKQNISLQKWDQDNIWITASIAMFRSHKTHAC